jgi:hypothetical protein
MQYQSQQYTICKEQMGTKFHSEVTQQVIVQDT